MRTLVTGGGGRLGREVVKYFPHAYAPSHAQLDVRNYGELSRVFGLVRPQLIIHLAALADVRACEDRQDEAWEVNVLGTENIVNLCRESEPKPILLYSSTPCVFDCISGGYVESSKPNPVSHYGRTKAAAEQSVLTYENALLFRTNFVPRSRWKYTKAFTDRFGTYLFSDEVAFVISQLPDSGIHGIVHIAGNERMSMYELARITTPDVTQMTMNEVDLSLSTDMSLASERIRTFPLTKSSAKPINYEMYKLAYVG